MIFVAALLIVATPLAEPDKIADLVVTEVGYAKKRGGASANKAGRRFGSCAAARKAGYSNMRRGQKGYSVNLDRDGDGVACDKIK